MTDEFSLPPLEMWRFLECVHTIPYVMAGLESMRHEDPALQYKVGEGDDPWTKKRVQQVEVTFPHIIANGFEGETRKEREGKVTLRIYSPTQIDASVNAFNLRAATFTGRSAWKVAGEVLQNIRAEKEWSNPRAPESPASPGTAAPEPVPT